MSSHAYSEKFKIYSSEGGKLQPGQLLLTATGKIAELGREELRKK